MFISGYENCAPGGDEVDLDTQYNHDRGGDMAAIEKRLDDASGLPGTPPRQNTRRTLEESDGPPFPLVYGCSVIGLSHP
jgi:hypothetical protein